MSLDYQYFLAGEYTVLQFLEQQTNKGLSNYTFCGQLISVVLCQYHEQLANILHLSFL